MRPSKTLVVSKRVGLDDYIAEYPQYSYTPDMIKDELVPFLKSLNIDGDELYHEYLEHNATLKEVESALRRHKLLYQKVLNTQLVPNYFVDIELMLCVGGDGTLLEPAHYIDGRIAPASTPVLAVNSFPWKSKGHWTRATAKDLGEKFDKIIADEHTVEKIPRVEVEFFNDKKSSALALNEVLFRKRDVDSAKYYIEVNGVSEHHPISSGVIIGLESGATGHIINVPYNQPWTGHEGELQYIVREIESKNYRIRQGFAREVKITSDDQHNVARLDGSVDKFCFAVMKGHYIIVRPSDKPLYMLSFAK